MSEYYEAFAVVECSTESVVLIDGQFSIYATGGDAEKAKDRPHKNNEALEVEVVNFNMAPPWAARGGYNGGYYF